MNRFLSAALLLLTTGNAVQAQEEDNKKITFSGYTEVYYAYNFNKPVNNTSPSFLYSYNRHNEVNLNLAMLKAAYNNDKIRASIAWAAGTYINANYAAEPGVLKNMYEANAGIKISRKSDLWIDAGIFSSHIGWESAIGKDNYTLTRSIAAENSPYFETGVKLSYTSPNQKWFLSGMVLNGWQRIQRPDGNTTPAFGTQVTFKPSEKLTLNSSTFIGSDQPDSLRQMRYFHDLYAIFRLNSHWLALAGFDYGIQQKTKGSSSYHQWYSPNVVMQYRINDANALAARGEYYHDPNGVIISTGLPGGFQTWGWSLNYDRQVYRNTVWRLEARGLHSKNAIFHKNKQDSSNDNWFITTALALQF
jgi:hypothetical protein